MVFWQVWSIRVISRLTQQQQQRLCDISSTVSPHLPLPSAHHLSPLFLYVSILNSSSSAVSPSCLSFSSCPSWRDRWLTTLTMAGAALPCSAEHMPHDKLPSSVCFANSPHRSPPRPVVTFCCILYMQIPANQLAHSSLCSLRCPLWLKWIDCGLKSTPASLPKDQGSAGHNRENGGKNKTWSTVALSSLFSLSSVHFILYRKLITAGIKHCEICWKRENGNVYRLGSKFEGACPSFLKIRLICDGKTMVAAIFRAARRLWLSSDSSSARVCLHVLQLKRKVHMLRVVS